MSYKIIVDSCGELFDDMKADGRFQSVPLELEVDGYHVVDDESFDQLEFIRRVKESRHSPKSSCPSPQRYVEAYLGEAEHVYVVTLSGNLSGSYNSAVLAKKLYLEENPKKNIGVIDSCSASVGQALIAMKVQELAKKGLAFEAVMEKIRVFRDEMNTKFVLESLETLRKNGRLNNLTAVVCNVLNIKPIMGATPDGQICKIGQARGISRAITDMAKAIAEDSVDAANRTLGIAHCNNYQRALHAKEEILKRIQFKNCVIVDTAGISSLYANDGGVIVCY